MDGAGAVRQFVKQNRIVKLWTVESLATRPHDSIGAGSVVSLERMPALNFHRGAMLKTRPAGHVRVNRFASFDWIKGWFGHRAVFGVGRKPAPFRLLGIENRIVTEHREMLLIGRAVRLFNLAVEPFPEDDRRTMFALANVSA